MLPGCLGAALGKGCQSASDLPSEISASNICSKMALLTLHCPQLRVLWSRSPHATVQIFKRLKEDQADADTAAAAAAGTEGSGGGRHTGDGGAGLPPTVPARASEGTVAAHELVHRLPGVTADNARVLRVEARTTVLGRPRADGHRIPLRPDRPRRRDAAGLAGRQPRNHRVGGGMS